jgi:hypothetical protein
MIKQRRKLSTLSNSNLRGSFYHRQAPSVSCQLCTVLKIELGKSKIVSGAEISDTMFADLRVTRPDTIFDTSIIHSLWLMFFKG